MLTINDAQKIRNAYTGLRNMEGLSVTAIFTISKNIVRLEKALAAFDAAVDAGVKRANSAKPEDRVKLVSEINEEIAKLGDRPSGINLKELEKVGKGDVIPESTGEKDQDVGKVKTKLTLNVIVPLLQYDLIKE